MTLVDLASLFTVEGGFSPTTRGTVTVQYWVGGRPSVDVDGADVRFSVPIRIPLQGDPVSIDMVPTAGLRCVKWSIEDAVNRRALTRFTEIPDVESIAFGDLVDVDPETFESSEEGKTAWEATVAAAQAILDDVRAHSLTATPDPTNPDLLILSFPAYLLASDGTSVTVPIGVA